MSSNHYHIPSSAKEDDRRRPDWLENDRRRTKPWVIDPSDRRSGMDRRLEDGDHSTN